jgi:TnpA family transposase
MLRVAGSLVTNQVRAYDLLRMFGRERHPTPLGQAFTEYGRIAKTLHLLAVVDPVDDTYRRQMHKQLTVQESRHKLARDICHGKKGTIHQAYRDGMEDQLGSLGLVLNAAVLWTTRYIDAATLSPPLPLVQFEFRKHAGAEGVSVTWGRRRAVRRHG